jgi:hypothetical protein
MTQQFMAPIGGDPLELSGSESIEQIAERLYSVFLESTGGTFNSPTLSTTWSELVANPRGQFACTGWRAVAAELHKQTRMNSRAAHAVECVSEAFGVSPADMLGRGRTRSVAEARFALFAVLRESAKVAEISRWLRRPCVAQIGHGLRRSCELTASCPEYSAKLSAARAAFAKSGVLK